MNYELFSPTEQKILKTLGRKQMTISEITEKIYGPFVYDAGNTVAGAVRRINRKCEYHKLPWFLNGAGRGRGGKTVWKDKR